MKRWILSLALVGWLASMAAAQTQAPAGPDYDKIADALQTIAEQIRLFKPQMTPAPAPTPAPTPQPAGPQLPILTDARVAVLKQMQTDQHPYWLQLKSIADRTVAGNPIYDDLGQASAIVYRATGDKSFAIAAWTQLRKVMSRDGRAANDVRQRYLDYLLVFAWVRDALTADQVQAFSTDIQQWSNYCLGVDQPQYTGSFRMNDSDQLSGQLQGLIMQAALGLPPNNLLQQHITNLNTGKVGAPVGGLTAAAADTSTVRNAYNWYVSVLAKGGEWPESSQYDANTVGCLVLPGFIASWDVLGKNYFPEVESWVPDACRAAVTDWTPALEGRVLWGDNDKDTAAGPNLYKMLPYLAALQFAANRVGAAEEAAQVGGLLRGLEAKYPEAVAQAEVHFFYFCDPYAVVKTPPASRYNYSPGVGLYRRIEGSTMFMAFSPARIDIDHEFNLLLSPRWFSGGEWVVAEPISYGGTGFADTANSLTFSGISTMRQQGFVNAVTAADYTYLEALTAGPLYSSDESWSPPPAWCLEGRRQSLWLPAQNTLIVWDRLNSTDPRADRPDLAGYTAADANRIKNSLHRHRWYWNCPAQPSLSDGAFQYATAGGQTVQFSYYSPTGSLQAASVDEHAAWSDYGIPAGQLMWNVSLNPVVERQWDCAMWVVRLHPSAKAPAFSTPQPGVAAVAVDGYTVMFSSDMSQPQLDPATPASGTGRTYRVGCSGTAPVVVTQ